MHCVQVTMHVIGKITNIRHLKLDAKLCVLPLKTCQ